MKRYTVYVWKDGKKHTWSMATPDSGIGADIERTVRQRIEDRISDPGFYTYEITPVRIKGQIKTKPIRYNRDREFTMPD